MQTEAKSAGQSHLPGIEATLCFESPVPKAGKPTRTFFFGVGDKDEDVGVARLAVVPEVVPEPET
jgi:hypothetical protein